MLEIGVQTKGILPEMSIEEGFAKIAKAGFTKIDFNMDNYLKNTDLYAGKTNKFFDYDMDALAEFFFPYLLEMKKNGITPSQMHAPYPVNVYWGKTSQNDYMQGTVIPKCIMLAELLGVPWMIVHPFKLQYQEGKEIERKRNLEYFKLLIPLLKECQVGICFENLYEGIGGRITEGVCADPEDAIWYIDTLNEIAGEELFGFCLDTGHLQLVHRDPYTYIKKMGKRLKCLHLHENDGFGDLHQMPYSFGREKEQGLDWNRILQALGEIDYQGTLSFETFPCMNSFPRPMADTVLRTIYDIGAYFAGEIERMHQEEPGKCIEEKQEQRNIAECEETSDESPAIAEEKKVRFGIIGTGRIAKRFVEDLKRVPRAEVVAVYNPNQDSCRQFAGEQKIAHAAISMEDFLSQVDAVYIATPHITHYDYAKDSLLAGKHVLCEKPMTFAKQQAEELFAIAREHHVILKEALKTAYCPGFQKMMEVARSGKIGEITDVEAGFTKLTATNLRELTDLRYGGSMTELGSYVVLPIMKLLGAGYQDMMFQSKLAENGLDTYTKMYFCYPNGMATGKVGLGVKSEGQLLISGTKGYILAESPWWLTKKFEVRFEDPNKKEVYRFPYEGSGLWYEAEAFLDEIESGTVDHLHNFIYGLSEAESIAMAGIMEQFLAQRQQEQSVRIEELQQKEKQVKLWAHRGCSMQYPENSLSAFKAAFELPQTEGIELDVQMTKDGEVVVFHDENVKRVTNGEGMVKDYTLAELQQLKLCEWEGSFETIPTLEQVLQLAEPYCKEKGKKINIELKTSAIHYAGIEEKTLHLVKKYGLEDYIVYSSFWAESLKTVKQLDAEVKTGMLAGKLSDCIKWGRYAGVDALHPWIGGFDCEIPEDMKDYPVRAYNGEEPFYRDGRILREKHLQKYAMFGATDVFTNVMELYE